MATAETARLVASLELQDKNFTRGLRNVERGVGRVDKKLSAVGGFVNRNLARGVDMLAANLVTGVFKGVESLVELEQQEAQTAAVLKSTGMAAGINGEQITALAEKYENLNAIIGDEVIRSGENMLLTFTNINKQAFEPALAAALDLNTAMGKGPEGLTSTVIQVGKALNDPVKGLTALRKVGVSFTKEQQSKIKSLVKEGKLYEAQQVILKELNKEFGGSFAAQGDTTAGKVAKFHDAVEDLQRTFAKALLPIIVKVADKLGKFLGDPAVIRGIEKAGQTLGQVFDEMLAAAERVPWKTIGDGLKMAAGFAGQMVKWFQQMPDWAQAFLIGGFVATKLPVIGGLVSELGKGLIKGVLGMTAGVVNLKAGTVIGGGGPPVPGGKGGGKGPLGLGLKGPGGLLLGLTGVGLAGMLASEFEDEIQGLSTDIGNGWRDWLRTNADINIPTISPKDIEWPFGPKNTPTILPEIFGGNGLLGGTPSERWYKPPPGKGAPSVRVPPNLMGNRGRDKVDPMNKIDLKPVVANQQKTTAAVNAQKEAITGTKTAITNVQSAVNTAKSAVTAMDANQKAAIIAQTAVNTAGNMLSVFQSARQVLAASGTTTAVQTGTSATRTAGQTVALSMASAANRIVTAVNGLDLSVNVTTVNRTSTVNNRYGPSGGSSTTQRAGGNTG